MESAGRFQSCHWTRTHTRNLLSVCCVCSRDCTDHSRRDVSEPRFSFGRNAGSARGNRAFLASLCRRGDGWRYRKYQGLARFSQCSALQRFFWDCHLGLAYSPDYTGIHRSGGAIDNARPRSPCGWLFQARMVACLQSPTARWRRWPVDLSSVVPPVVIAALIAAGSTLWIWARGKRTDTRSETMKAMADERAALLLNWSTLTRGQQKQITDLQTQGSVDDNRIKDLEDTVSQLTKDNRACERRCAVCDRRVRELSRRLAALEKKK